MQAGRPVVLAALFASSLVVPALSYAQESEQDMATVRAVTEKYRDVQVALADGYMEDPTGMCVSGAMTGDPSIGDMGLHYFRPDLVGITATEPRVDGADGTIEWDKPEVLVYQPGPDGSRELLAVEYLVFQKAWKSAGHDGPPTFGDQSFYAMADDPDTEMDEAHGFMPHYELHVWTARENPAGMFAEFNPAVKCPAPSEAPAVGGR